MANKIPQNYSIFWIAHIVLEIFLDRILCHFFTKCSRYQLKSFSYKINISTKKHRIPYKAQHFSSFFLISIFPSSKIKTNKTTQKG